MAQPSHSNNTSRNRFSVILQLATSNSGGATLKKKKQGGSRRRRDATSSIGTGQDVETDIELSPGAGPYETQDFASPGTSMAARSSAVSIPGTHTPSVPSVKNFGGSTSHFDFSSDVPPIPPVPSTKDLDHKEMLRLLKKARKLSRRLGELAIPSAPPSPSRDEQGFSIPQSSRRSPHCPTAPDAISRTSSRTCDVAPVLPHGRMTFARPDTPSDLPMSASYPYLPSTDGPSILTPMPASFHSPAESQVQVPGSDALRNETLEGRAGQPMMPLNHFLPTELILRSSSPADGRNASTMSAASARRKHRKRLSLDLSSLVGSGQSVQSPIGSETPRGSSEILKDWDEPVIKRSRSLWTTRPSKSRNLAEDVRSNPSQSTEECDDIFQDLRSTRSGSLLSDKQRALNLKRARKMAQLFGSEPPPALFQTATMNILSDDNISQLSPITESNRNSIASTLLSAAPVDFAPSTPNSSREKRRPHSIASSVVSVLSQPPQIVSDSRPAVEPTASTVHTPPPFSSYTESVPKGSLRPSSSHSARSRHTARSSSESDIVVPSTSFRQRRLRAAKLSKFFGVDLQQLEPEMASSKASLPLPLLSRSASLSTHLESERNHGVVQYSEPSEHEDHRRKREVDVKVVSRPGLFNWGSSQQRDVDVGDVMLKLRQMRAAH